MKVSAQMEHCPKPQQLRQLAASHLKYIAAGPSTLAPAML